MIVSSLVEAKRFKVTENRERADIVLKGTAREETSQEVHAHGEGTAVGGSSGGYRSRMHICWRLHRLPHGQQRLLRE